MRKHTIRLVVFAIFAVVLLAAFLLTAFRPSSVQLIPAANGSGEGIALMGEPVLQLLERSPEELAELFQEELDSRYTSSVEIAGVTFHFRNSEVMQADIPQAGWLSKDGAALDQNADSLIELLGEPDSILDKTGELGGGYNLYYNFAGFDLSFYGKSPEDTAWEVKLSPNTQPLA